MSVAIPANTSIIVIDTRLVSKTITLPSVTLNPGRVLFLKDYYGTTAQSTLTVTTQGTDLIDDYNTSYVLSNNFGTVTFISDGVTSWRMTGFYDGGLSYVTNIASLIPPVSAITLSLSSPTGGTVTITPSTYAVSYRFYINTSTSILSPTYSATTTVTGSPVSFTTTLRIGITYYAIVVPYNAVDNPGSQSSSTGTYLTITPGSASSVLILLTPTSGTITILPALNAETYDYYVSTNTTIGNAIVSGTTSFTNTPISFTAQITGNVPYYPIVVARNPYTAGSQTVSDPATINSPTAITVTFLSATFIGGLFNITAGLYATSYTYYITTSSSSIASPILTGTTTQAGVVSFSCIYPSSTTYYAIVIPINSFGSGPQAASNGIAFTITLPSAPTVTFNSLTSTGGQFTASFVNYATYYTYYISTTTSITNAVYTNTTTLNILTVNFTVVTPLLTNTNYYVIIVPRNSYGSGSQGTSAALSFILPSGGSATFTGVTYGGGNLQIAAATNATFYNYYISTSTNIANSIYSWTTTLTGVPIPILTTLQGSTTYYAIVIPYNTYGQGPQFTSSGVSFTLPAGGSVVFSSYTTTNGSLTITASSNTTRYTYYISPDTTLQRAFFSDTTTTTGSAVTFSTSLQESTSYYIIVVPSNSYGPGPQFTSSPISFTLPTGGSITLLTLVATGGSIQITAATNATSYNYYISTSLSTQWAAFSGTTTTTGSPVTFSGASFSSGVNYYAIVVPINAYGPGPQSATSSTSINLPSGGTVTLSDLSYTGCTLLITPTTNATLYIYYISLSKDIVDAVYTDTTTITGSPITLTITLLVNEPYYAIVIPINAYGSGQQLLSLPVSFNTPSPTLIVFTSITYIGGTILITPSLNATLYTYYISPTTSLTDAVYTNTTTTAGSPVTFTKALISQQNYYALVIPSNIFGSAQETASNGLSFVLPVGGSVTLNNLTSSGGNIVITAGLYTSSYTYYISTDTTIGNAVFTASTSATGSPVTFTVSLQNATTYYAIVVPMNTGGPGPQFTSNGMLFIVPYGGSVTTSALKSTGGSLQITESSYATLYTYYINTSTSIVSPVYTNTTTVTGSAVTFSTALSGSTTYYVIVVPSNMYGSGPQFTTSFILPGGGSVAISGLTTSGGNLTITASTNVTSYNYYISTTTSVANAILTNTTTTTGSPIAFTTTITAGTSYYAIVVPINSYGSGPQFTFNFTIPSGGSIAITGATTTGGNITIIASTGATLYTYYINTSTSIVSPLYINTTTTTGSIVPFIVALTPGTTYYAIVVPSNTYSSGTQITSNFILPSGGSVATPTLTSTGGSILITASTNATSYIYYISTSTSIANAVFTGSTSTTGSSVTFTVALQNGTNYYVIVVPTNSYGSGLQFVSGSSSFTLPSGGSVALSSITTSGGSITISASTGATLYTYYINTSTSIVSPLYTSTTTTTGSAVTFLTSLTASTTYYAIVVPSNSYGSGTQFTASFIIPGGGSASITGLTTSGGNLTITTSTGATSYTYYISTTTSIANAVLTNTTTTTGSAIAFLTTITPGTTYYALVVPTNAYASGTQITTPFVLPSGGAAALSGLTTSGGSITITASTGAIAYTFYINTSVSIVSPIYTSTTSTTGSAVAFTATLIASTTYYAIVIPTNTNGSGAQFSSTGVAVSSGGLYSFTGTLTFTPAGATGRSGPTLSQCTTAYSSFGAWVTNTAYFNMTQAGYQRWTVPATRSYTISVAGAGSVLGSSYTGVIVNFTYTFTQGDILNIVVGQLGLGNAASSGGGAGGSGGTFLVNTSTSTLIAVGGGAGGYKSALTGNNGAQGATAASDPATIPYGGSGGGGGSCSGDGPGGSGAGYTGNGLACNLETSCLEVASLSYTNGATGGLGAYCSNPSPATLFDGGFGGGGGAYFNSLWRCGGGGGYSGGGSGGYAGAGSTSGLLSYGGGGGSYISASATSVTYTTNTGQGYVSIT